MQKLWKKIYNLGEDFPTDGSQWDPNSKGFDLTHRPTLEAIDTARGVFKATASFLTSLCV